MFFTLITKKLFNAKQVDVNKAETDQEKEWSKLNQVIDSQTVENINVTLMNSNLMKHIWFFFILSLFLFVSKSNT